MYRSGECPNVLVLGPSLWDVGHEFEVSRAVDGAAHPVDRGHAQAPFGAQAPAVVGEGEAGATGACHHLRGDGVVEPAVTRPSREGGSNELDRARITGEELN